jgi:hypothetical protein
MAEYSFLLHKRKSLSFAFSTHFELHVQSLMLCTILDEDEFTSSSDLIEALNEALAVQKLFRSVIGESDLE